MKRIFSVLLILCMLVCLMPVQAHAYDCYYTVFVHKDGVYVSEIYDWWGAAAPGTPITLQTPAQHEQLLSGYQISRVEVWESDSDAPAQTGVNSFTMPDCSVDVMVFYTPASGGTNPGTTTQYNITRGTISNGSVLLSQERASANTTITVTPQPSNNFALSKLTVTDSSGASVAVTRTGSAYKFTMPASDVVVEAEFVPAITVSFDCNGGSGTINPVQIPAGGSLPELPVPQRDGYFFLGWYNGNDLVTLSTKFTGNTTVCAHWLRAAHITDPSQNEFQADIDLSDEDVLKTLAADEINNKKDVTIRLSVTPLPDSSVPVADKAAIEAKAGSDTVAAYLDIKLLKKVGNSNEEPIPNTSPNTVPITMTVDAGVLPANVSSVDIIYYHNGQAKKAGNVSYNAASRSLKFHASEFSTYALVYKVGALGALDNVPKTGDVSILNGWLLMALCATAMLTGVSVYNKKRAR